MSLARVKSHPFEDFRTFLFETPRMAVYSSVLKDPASLNQSPYGPSAISFFTGSIITQNFFDRDSLNPNYPYGGRTDSRKISLTGPVNNTTDPYYTRDFSVTYDANDRFARMVLILDLVLGPRLFFIKRVDNIGGEYLQASVYEPYRDSLSAYYKPPNFTVGSQLIWFNTQNAPLNVLTNGFPLYNNDLSLAIYDNNVFPCPKLSSIPIRGETLADSQGNLYTIRNDHNVTYILDCGPADFNGTATYDYKSTTIAPGQPGSVITAKLRRGPPTITKVRFSTTTRRDITTYTRRIYSNPSNYSATYITLYGEKDMYANLIEFNLEIEIPYLFGKVTMRFRVDGPYYNTYKMFKLDTSRGIADLTRRNPTDSQINKSCDYNCRFIEE